MDCLFCEGKVRCRTEPRFNYNDESPFELEEFFEIVEVFCKGCQTFLRVRISDDDARNVLEKVPKLFDCAINFDKGILS